MIENNEAKNSFPPLVQNILTGMEEVKAQNISVLNLQELDNAVCDYFVIAQGTSNTQVKAITDSVEETVRKNLSDKPWHIEGTDNGEWILMDYVSVAVHVFLPRSREFYDLEGLWGDAAITNFGQD